MKKFIWTLITIHFFLIFSLSIHSAYKIPNFSDANWMTVLFLTPLGIAYNFIQANSAITSFYFDLSKGNVSWSFSQFIWVLISYVGLIFLAGFYFRKRSKL